MALSVGLFAQTADDALRFSQSYWQGTARSMAMGNAFGSLGADFSVASTNPAGMGMFRTGEFTITPEIFSRNTNSVYNGISAEDVRTVFDLSNLGYVIAMPINNGSDWKYFQFGFGMNRTNNYNSSVYIQGPNAVSSKLDVYKAMADGIYYDDLYYDYPYDLYPAWETYLLDLFSDTSDYYYTAVPFAGTMQTQSIYTRGSTNEWLFSFSGNYNDKVYVGATIGLPYIRFFRESRYGEYDHMDTIPYFDNWSYTEKLTTTGWGINLKLGAIVKPVEWLRLGAAFHTPTYYWSMNDSWYTYTTSNLEEYGSWNYKSITGNFDYTLSTPLRAIGSASILFGQYGLITGEYEYADYSTSRFSERGAGISSSYIQGVNNDISDYFTQTHNYRAGTEWRYQNFSFRAGYAYYGSPYDKDLNDGKRQQYSGGIGYRNSIFSLDLAYVHSVQDEDYYLYSYDNIQTNPTAQTIKTNAYVLTLKLFLD